MTKYVLNSGGAKKHPALKKQFHRELIKGLGTELKFLLCNFAQPREDWEAKFPNYCESIREDLSDDVKPSFELAMPAEFTIQCRAANIIYFHGGDDHLMEYWAKQFDLEELFAGKVVATNSASSDMLAAHFWTCDWRQCFDGLGILPIKFIPHYLSEYGVSDPRGPIDWQKAREELAAYSDTSLPIHALKEGEYIVIEK